ncbi:MAG: SBBP repeat-containing protein [Ginsengibacter sp.]
MKRKLHAITLLWILAFLSNHANSQNFVWAKQMGGTDYDHSRSMAVDAAGNVYTTGEFRGTADFDPGAGIFNLSSPAHYDIFVSKSDASGNFIWAVQMGGSTDDMAYSIAVDGGGNVYTTGIFSGTADFDPGAGIFTMTSGGAYAIFVSKLDAAGNFVWAKKLGGTSNYDQARSIAADASGNVYIAGDFYGTTDFDPGPAIFNLTSGYDLSPDVFISKLDASGNFVWANQLGGISNDDAYAVTVDASGNVYTTGNFYGTADFDPGPGIFNMTPIDDANYKNYDIFISKLDASGNFVWAKQLGGPHVTGSSLNDFGYSIAVDAGGNVYTTGYFPGTADFDPDTGVYNLTSAGATDIFVSKLDPSGNFLWAKQMGGTLVDEAYAITTDASGNVYTTGYFFGTADFDPGSGTYVLSSAGGTADAVIFVSKLDASGNFLWARQMSGASYGYALSIAVDATGSVYTTGYFGGTADFDPGAGMYNLASAGVDDIFISKLSNSTLPIGLLNFTAIAKDKKIVAISWTTTSEINNNYFTVEHSKDAINFEQAAIIKGAGNSNLPSHYQAVDESPYSGTSYYRLKQTDFDGKFKYSNIVQVQLNSMDKDQVTIFPNPAQNVLHVALPFSQSESIAWQVQDGAGKIIKKQTGKLSSSQHALSIDISNLPKGIYYMAIKKGNDTAVKKFIKQ